CRADGRQPHWGFNWGEVCSVQKYSLQLSYYSPGKAAEKGRAAERDGGSALCANIRKSEAARGPGGPSIESLSHYGLTARYAQRFHSRVRYSDMRTTSKREIEERRG